MKPVLTTTASALALALTFGPATAQQNAEELNRGVIDACRAIIDADAAASADADAMKGSDKGALRADAGIQSGEQIPQAVPDYPNNAQAAEAMAQIGNAIDPLDDLENPAEQIASTPGNGAGGASTNRPIDMQAGDGTLAKRYRATEAGFDEKPGRIETGAGADSAETAEATIAERYVPIYGDDNDQRSADAGPVKRPDRDMVDHQDGSFDAARNGRTQDGPIAETYDDFAATIDEPGRQRTDAANPLRESSEMINEGLTGAQPGLDRAAPADDAADQQTAGNGADPAKPAPTDRQSVQRAYQVALAVLPHVRFTGWQRTNEGQSAYVFAGVNRATGRPTAIYMTDGARVNEIEERIALRSVPTDLRRTIGSEIEGLRVSSVARSLRNDFDVYYEFGGVLRSGRPVNIEIRADGEDFTMSAPTNS